MRLCWPIRRQPTHSKSAPEQPDWPFASQAAHSRFRRAGSGRTAQARVPSSCAAYFAARRPSRGRYWHSRPREPFLLSGTAASARGRYRASGGDEPDEGVFIALAARAAIQRRQAASRPASAAPQDLSLQYARARSCRLFRRNRARSDWPRNRLRETSADGPACRVERKSCVRLSRLTHARELLPDSAHRARARKRHLFYARYELALFDRILPRLHASD